MTCSSHTCLWVSRQAHKREPRRPKKEFRFISFNLYYFWITWCDCCNYHIHYIHWSRLWRIFEILFVVQRSRNSAAAHQHNMHTHIVVQLVQTYLSFSNSVFLLAGWLNAEVRCFVSSKFYCLIIFVFLWLKLISWYRFGCQWLEFDAYTIVKLVSVFFFYYFVAITHSRVAST